MRTYVVLVQPVAEGCSPSVYGPFGDREAAARWAQARIWYAVWSVQQVLTAQAIGE